LLNGKPNPDRVLQNVSWGFISGDQSTDLGGDVSNFQNYARFYDLLYARKDYVQETRYVVDTLRKRQPNLKSIFELGCGTGGHARAFAGEGLDVFGIDISPEMIELARSKFAVRSGQGCFTCAVGNICDFQSGQTFDAAVSLFHVMSYLTTDGDFVCALSNAASQIGAGGQFLFDVWHKESVLAQRPEARTRELRDAHFRICRTATPVHESDRDCVTIHYDMVCEDLEKRHTEKFSEKHVMRYFAPDDIARFADQTGFKILEFHELITRKPADKTTWAIAYLLQKM